MNNAIQLFNMIKGIKNPKNAVINMVKSNNNPMIKNLVQMAEKGDNKGIEEFARNLYKEQGRNFDEEYSNFINMFK
jgi:hypothetical protein